MKNPVSFAFLVAILLLSLCGRGFSAQSSIDVPIAPDEKQVARSEVLGEAALTASEEEEYVIGHGDILGVSVYGEGDMAVSSLAGTARAGTGDADARPVEDGIAVMLDGRISLQHIGDVEVVGMTLTQLADYLKKLYASIYDDPIVTTTLVQSNSRRYTIMGNVMTPGIFYIDYPLSIVQTIARSGGFNEWANRETTLVREKLKSGDEKIFKGNSLRFDYEDFISGKELDRNIIIRSGDTIIVH